jgi:Transposase DDE domain
VLVTNAWYDIEAIGQLYRNRCDCENSFDELKTQWGWSGFTTHDMRRSQIMARAVALVYKWWSWYVQAGNPGARRAAVTSRPLMLAAIGRAAGSGGQRRADDDAPHADARRRGGDQIDDRQCSSGCGVCAACCGAVARPGPMARVAAQHLPANRRPIDPAKPASGAATDRVPAVLRVIEAEDLGQAKRKTAKRPPPTHPQWRGGAARWRESSPAARHR